MRDKSYDNVFTKTSLFEIIGLSIGVIVHLPLLFFFPFAYAALLIGTTQYYWMHRKSHIDVEWGKKKMPWHYAHHMAKNQHDNWGVRSNMIDNLVGNINVK
jgi:sterol desaturase/sphingolipid hydroxylase (fatty acid hydroxylase superfamily)